MPVEMKSMAAVRQQMPSLATLGREADISQAEMHAGEEVPFVSAYFGDQSDGYSNLHVTASLVNGSLEPERGRDGSHIVWIENARTGELLPTRVGASGQPTSQGNNGDDVENEEKDSAEIDESSPLILPKPLIDGTDGGGASQVEAAEADVEDMENGDSSGHSYAAMFLRGIFILFQGMLAGFNFISVSYLVLDDASFLATYQASANEVRRLCFILSTLAALGAVDNLMSLISRSSRPSLSGNDSTTYGIHLIKKENTGAFVFAASACIAYLIAMILTILLGATDTLIYYKFGYASNVVDWITPAVASNADRLQQWRKLAALRIAFAALGWLCSCFLVWKDLIAKDGRGHELVRLQGVISRWRTRVNMLEGGSLEECDGPSLRKLVALQSLGYERTSAALRVMDQSY
jgi:hypothetical protein